MLLSICLVHNDISILSFDLCRRLSREKPPDHIPPEVQCLKVSQKYATQNGPCPTSKRFCKKRRKFLRNHTFLMK